MWTRLIGAASLAFHSVIPHYLLIMLSTILVINPLNPAKAAQEFTVFRAQQYDFQGVNLGSRASVMSCESQAISNRLVARKCLVLNLTEVTLELIKKAMFHNIAGLLIILPSQPMSSSLQQHFMHLEHEILNEEITLPIYFAIESPEINAVFDEIKEMTATDIESTSTVAILNVIWSTGYRLSVQTVTPKVAPSISITNIEGVVESTQNSKSPLVVICAYYDAMSAIPSLAYGSDANGSGVVALLEMARIFSRFYADPATTPKYDLLFLLSGGGKFNFMGTKRWLDQKIEDTTGLNMLDSVTQVICLESLGTAQFGRNLHVHLSRPPKDGSFSQRFIDSLRLAAQLHPFPSTDNSTESSVQVVHKKINLNQELLGWEHERFSIHRLPGMTLSSWPSVQVANQWRQTSLDGGPLSQPTTTSKTSRMRGTVDPSVISRNTRVITEALIRVLLDLDGQESAFNSSTLVTKEWLSEVTSGALLDLMVRQPRSTQMLHVKPRSLPHGGAGKMNSGSSRGSATRGQPNENWPGLVGSLERHLSKLLPRVMMSQHPLVRDGSKPSTTTSSSSSGAGKDSNGNSARNQESAELNDVASGTQSMRTSSILTSAAAASDVDVVLYTEFAPTTLTVHKLKSSIFDLVVACGVASYLFLIYLFLEHFHKIQHGLPAPTRGAKIHVQ